MTENPSNVNFDVSDIEMRRTGIGGSDAGSVLGVNPWKSNIDLYLEKIGQVEPDDLSEKESVMWGNLLEDPVAQEYARRTGNKIRRNNRTKRHPKYDFIFAHIDRDIVGVNKALEVKTTGLHMASKFGDEDTDDLPSHYLCQVHHYIAVFGLDGMDVAVLIGGQELKIFHVERDPEFEAILTQKEYDFWQCVQNKIPPTPLKSEDALKLFPNAEKGEVKVADVVIQTQLQTLQNIKNQIKELQEQEDELKASIQNFMGNAEILEAHDGQKLATWSTRSFSRLDNKALKKDHPDLVDQYTTSSSSRTFLIKNTKNKEAK